MHIAALLAFVPSYFTWTGLVLFFVFMWLTANIGITLTYHRLLTHRSFKTPKWFEYFLTLCGCLAWQGGPVQWVGVHRIHHAHSDEDLDPHTPNHGFTWAHAVWCLHKEAEDGRKGVDAAKDLLRDPGHRIMNKFFWIPNLLLIPVLYFGGEAAAAAGISASGMSWLVWGVALRTVVVYHGTWFVNSASHTWGYRNFETKDRSTNLWWVALLSFGEGWHNNHHAYQRSAAHGLRWYELDVTYWTIRLLEKVGLARDVVLPKPDEMPH
ncbi:MAG: fatty acid desaturase [Phycisphaeraceae bacterium]